MTVTIIFIHGAPLLGRGGPLRRLLKPDKGRPFSRACQTVEVGPADMSQALYGLHPATNDQAMSQNGRPIVYPLLWHQFSDLRRRISIRRRSLTSPPAPCAIVSFVSIDCPPDRHADAAPGHHSHK